MVGLRAGYRRCKCTGAGLGITRIPQPGCWRMDLQASGKPGWPQLHCASHPGAETLRAPGVSLAVSLYSYPPSFTRFSSQISSKNSGVIFGATYALAQIASWSDGAQVIVDSQALEHVSVLLESPSPDVREWTCKLVGNLAGHKSTAPAVLELNPCERLVSLLQ
jgi:hypothetical protein